MTSAVRWPLRLALLLAPVALLGCGGGGSGGDGRSAPAFTQHPQSRTAKPGASVTFTAAATGTPAPSLQWERSADRASWSAIAGATAATHTFTAQLSDNGAWFRLRATNAVQAATSADAQLRVTSVDATWRLDGSLWGIALDGQGNVYVTDFTGQRVVKTSATGAPAAQWGSPGTGASQLNTPKYLATDATGAVYVADTGNSRVQKFDGSGAYQLQWGTHGEGSGTTPAPDGTFNGPTGIAVDAARGFVYVVDSNNDRVQKFDLSGAFITKWGTAGTGDGEFRFHGTGQGPEGGVAVDASGNVYVVDNMNQRVQKFGSDGAFLATWGSAGTGDGQFLYPSGIAVDSTRGFVYVVDNTTSGNLTGNVCKVSQFDLSGAFVSSWQTMTLEGVPEAAISVATDAAGNVYVAQGASIAKYVP